MTRFAGFLAAAVAALSLAACGQSDEKTYDISPIFPLTSDKCAKYDGDSEGTGIGAACWVTKAKCEEAVQDWQAAMDQGGVTDATRFTCN